MPQKGKLQKGNLLLVVGEAFHLFNAQRFPNRSFAGIQTRNRRSEVQHVIKVLAGGHADAIFNVKYVASSDEKDSHELVVSTHHVLSLLTMLLWQEHQQLRSCREICCEG